MGADGFWSLFSRGKLPECPFCTDEYEMEESRKVLGAWYCPRCDTTFKLSKDDLEPVYDFDPNAELFRRQTCFSPTDRSLLDDGSTGIGGLCRTCQHNQTIIVQLLSAYEPVTSSSSSFDQMTAQYRRDLERRYPLCQSCKYYVDQRLSSLQLKLKSKKMASSKVGGVERLHELERLRKEVGRSSISFFFCLNLLSDALILAQIYALINLKVLRDYVLEILPFTLPLALEKASSFSVVENSANLVCAFAVLGILKGFSTDFWTGFLYASLSCLRFALYHKGMENTQMVQAATALILLIDISLLTARKTRQRTRKLDARQINTSSLSVPMNGIESRNKSFSKDSNSLSSPSKSITMDLMDVDWGLGSSAPKSSGSTPFSPSLPTIDKKSFLAPSRLDPSKVVSSSLSASLNKSDSTFNGLSFSMLPKLKPSALTIAEPPSGLESVMGGFSFKEPPAPKKIISLPTISIPKSFSKPELGFLGESILTGLLILFRIWAKQSLPFIMAVLLIAFVMRGFMINKLKPSWWYGCCALAFGRLSFIVAQLSEPDFSEIVKGSLWIRLLCLFTDLALLAAR